MKRGSEHQLSKGEDTDEDSDDIPQIGIQKADEAALARRTIRAMPKRAMGMSASMSSVTPDKPKFSGFPGFGVPSSASFTFTSPSASAPATSSPQTQTNSTNSFFSSPLAAAASAPAISASASSATKTFASFLGTSAPTPPTTLTDENNSADIKYYSSLRGLNVSFVSALAKAVEADPFLDLAELLERYRKFRGDIKKEFDNRTRTETVNPTTSFGSISSPLANATPKPSPGMPVPQASFSGFSASSQTPFSFPSSSTTSTPSSGNSTASTSNPKPSFSFNSSSFGSSSATLSFGSSSASPPNSTLFGGTSSTPTSVPSFLFGSPPSTEVKEGEKPKSNASNPINPFGARDAIAPPSPFGNNGAFGSGSGSKPNPFGGFGKPPSGSIGNPVGFVFGTSPPPKSSEDGEAEPASSSTLSPKIVAGNIGASPAPTPSEFSTREGTPEADAVAPEDGGDEASKMMPAATVHDADGEGEENEETTHSARTKVFKLVKTESGPNWVDLGIGILKLKNHNETDAKRFLLRNSSTGKILINFKVYAGLNVTRKAKFVSFVGHDNGASTTFRLRVKTEADAVDLKNAIDKDVAAVEAKAK